MNWTPIVIEGVVGIGLLAVTLYALAAASGAAERRAQHPFRR